MTNNEKRFLWVVVFLTCVGLLAVLSARGSQAQTVEERLTDLETRVCVLEPGCSINTTPLADAGPNQTVQLGSVTLDGSNSSDPNNDALTFDWSFVSVPAGSLASISNPGSVNPAFTADLEGDYLAQLTVSDGAESSVDTVTITATAAPPPPVGLALLASHLPLAGEWNLVPNTAFATWTDAQGNLIRVSDTEAGTYSPSIRGGSGSTCVLDCWNGAGYDPVTRKMYFFGGGHGGYYGNEVYELDLEALSLERITEPSNIQYVNGKAVPLNGPTATHTYHGPIAANGKLYIFMTGNSTHNDQWVLDIATGLWTQLTDIGHFFYPMAVYNDAVDEIFVLAGRNIGIARRLDATSGQVITASSFLGWFTSGSAVMVDGEVWTLAQEYMHWWNPTDYSHGRLMCGTGAGCQPNLYPAGLKYQSGAAKRGNKVWYWGGDKTLYALDTQSLTWETVSPATGPVDHIGDGRVFNKWLYLPELDAFAGYYNPNEGLWLYCAPDGCNP